MTVTPDSGPYERSDLALPDQPQSVAVADFDGDGRKDLVVRDEGDGVSLFLQRAVSPRNVFELRMVHASVPASSIFLGGWVQLRAFDVDADGRMDLLAGPRPWQVFMNRLPLDFEALDLPRDPACGVPERYAVGDFDADRTLDLLCFERAAGQVWRGLKYESGQLTSEQAPLGQDLTYERIVSVVDTNADGADELVVSDDGTIKTLQLVGDELRTTQRASVCADGFASGAVVFDADHSDGLDIAVGCRPVEVVLATRGVDNLGLPYNGAPATTADLDGDGTRELVVVDDKQLRFAAFDSTGYHGRGDVDVSGGRGQYVLALKVAAADLDGDGKDELIAARRIGTASGSNQPDAHEDRLTVLWSTP